METRQALVIFASAGASKAVAPDQFPTTIEFFQRVPAELRSKPLFETLEAFYTKLGHEQVDIERILGGLQTRAEHASAHQDDKHPLGFLVKDKRAALAFTNHQIQLPQLVGAFSVLAAECRDLQQEINQLVYDLYGEEAPNEGIEGTWGALLKAVSPA